ncbi:DUF481 domain-containing protein [Emcibacter sp.]|uniref:DUF481 domain-containing protein n=1 Tax=Emcibacter sp. TaxID=1979954 RepID=UPI002AA925F6|nr:DUF481 domain-containing protein [Emcibacter sp.]
MKRIALTAVMSCAFVGHLQASAEVNPAVMAILQQAAKTDSGANFQTVLDLVVAANPEQTEEILAAAEPLRPAPPMENPESQNPYFSLQGWDGEVDLSVMTSSGNTDQQSFGIAGKMKRDNGKYHSRIGAFFDFNKNSGVKDRQRWGLSYKLDYDFSEHMYLTGFLGYKNDQFGSFRERVTTSAGAGYRLMETEEYVWNVEGGPTVLFTKNFDGADYESSFNAYAASEFVWSINERSEFSNNSQIVFGDRTVMETSNALKVKINGALSSKFSFDISYDKDAPADRETTDTIARAGLLYDF